MFFIPVILGIGTLLGGGAAWYATTETATQVAAAAVPKGPLVQVGEQHNTSSSSHSIWLIVGVITLALWLYLRGKQ